VEQLGELAEKLKGEASPVEAAAPWLRSMSSSSHQKGLSAALALAARPIRS